MGVTGRPTAGARYELERVDTGAGTDADAGAQRYRGHVHLPDASYALEVTVELPGGAVGTHVDPSAPSADELQRACTALVRAAVKGALSSGRALPRKIGRWRG
jgi:hypothetical protein